MIARDLAERGLYRWRGEAFDVRARPDGPALARIDAARSRRSAFRRWAFTSTAWSAALTACICGSLGGRMDKLLDPGKLDHIVAGGVPAGLGAGGNPDQGSRGGSRDPARTGRGRGSCRDDRLRDGAARGAAPRLAVLLRPDAARGFRAGGRRWRGRGVRTLADRRVSSKRCATTDDFKFNVNLVLIDLFIRRDRSPLEAAAYGAELGDRRWRPADCAPGRRPGSGEPSLSGRCSISPRAGPPRWGSRGLPAGRPCRAAWSTVAPRPLALPVLVALEAVALLVVPALVGLRVLLLAALTVRLALLLRLVHRVQDAEVMFRVLEKRFRHHPVAAAGRVAAELQIFLEKLLGGAANADFGSVAVEDVVAIERNSAARMMADRTARSASTAATTARAMVAATHALHVHTVAVVLSHWRWACGRVGRPIERPRVIPLANHDPSALMMAREGFV